jgi:hypothetical protein
MTLSVFDIHFVFSSDYTIGICCFSTKHASLRRKNKDWLVRNQDNDLLMKNKITETDWENVIEAEVDINSACSNFTKTFLNIAKNFPVNRYCITINNRY